MSETDRRCPSCGALAARDAEWCGQCLGPLRGEDAPEGTSGARGDPGSSPGSPGPDRGAPAGVERSVLTARGADGQPSWPCPVCEHENPLSAERCEICGAPFGRLFAEPERAVEVDPSAAMRWSVLVPGLGHWLAGHRLDGVARMVLFAWVFGTLIVLILSGVGGSTLAILLLYLAALLGLEVTSAIDAGRIAAGNEPLVSSRTLLWAAVALVGASVLLATFLALPAARGR